MDGQPCCDDCGEAERLGLAAPCGGAPVNSAMVAGITTELQMAKWFLENRWAIIGASFAAGGLAFGIASYFINRDKRA